MCQSWYPYQVGTESELVFVPSWYRVRVGIRTKLVPSQSWYPYQVGTRCVRVGIRTKSYQVRVGNRTKLVPSQSWEPYQVGTKSELVTVPSWYQVRVGNRTKLVPSQSIRYNNDGSELHSKLTSPVYGQYVSEKFSACGGQLNFKILKIGCAPPFPLRSVPRTNSPCAPSKKNNIRRYHFICPPFLPQDPENEGGTDRYPKTFKKFSPAAQNCPHFSEINEGRGSGGGSPQRVSAISALAGGSGAKPPRKFRYFSPL